MTDEDASVARVARRRRWVAAVPVAVATLVWGADQAVKNWVVQNLTEHEPVPVLGDTLSWVFVRNPGAAFSLGVNTTWVFTALSTAVAVFVLCQLRKIGSRAWAVFLGLLLGGTIGNLTDRLLREPGFPNGHVIDFIYTPWIIPAIYNIADIAICAGMALFVLITLLGVRLDGTPKRVLRQRVAAGDAAHREPTP